MKKQPLVCIVIVNWNGGEKIKNCLRSLKKTNYNNYKVILVDNGSEKGSIPELLKISPKMEVIKLSRNFGYTIGQNVGWKQAVKKYNTKYICAMDSDIVTIQKDWLSHLVKEMEKSELNGVSGGKLVFENNHLQKIDFLDWSTPFYLQEDKGQADIIKEVKIVGGACILIKTSVIKKIGYYDENFFYGPNDCDFCLRAREAGFKVIYNGFVKSIHLGSSTYAMMHNTEIFGAQIEGNLIYTSRHFGAFRGIKMAARQIGRIFITKRNHHGKMELSNFIYHRDVFRRAGILFKATLSAIQNYKKIKNGDYSKFIVK